MKSYWANRRTYTRLQYLITYTHYASVILKYRIIEKKKSSYLISGCAKYPHYIEPHKFHQYTTISKAQKKIVYLELAPLREY